VTDNRRVNVEAAGTHTGCIKGFFEAEKCMENALEITNPINKFCTLKNVMKIQVFQL